VPNSRRASAALPANFDVAISDLQEKARGHKPKVATT
jgi:hypothetical protein